MATAVVEVAASPSARARYLAWRTRVEDLVLQERLRGVIEAEGTRDWFLRGAATLIGGAVLTLAIGAGRFFFAPFWYAALFMLCLGLMKMHARDNCRLRVWAIERARANYGAVLGVALRGTGFALFLRDFGSEHSVTYDAPPDIAPPLPGPSAKWFEPILEPFARVMPVVRLFNKKDDMPAPASGSLDIAAADEDWVSVFRGLAVHARFVVICVNALSEGVMLELRTLAAAELLSKTVVFVSHGALASAPSDLRALIAQSAFAVEFSGRGPRSTKAHVEFPATLLATLAGAAHTMETPLRRRVRLTCESPVDVELGSYLALRGLESVSVPPGADEIDVRVRIA